MSVIFTSTIKMQEGSDTKWFIELKDMVDSRVEHCFDMDEYTKKVEELGQDYGGNIDQVNWYKDKDVPEYVMDEIRLEMARIQREIEEQTGEKLIKEES